jgi:hypothetical protein
VRPEGMREAASALGEALAGAPKGVREALGLLEGLELCSRSAEKTAALAERCTRKEELLRGTPLPTAVPLVSTATELKTKRSAHTTVASTGDTGSTAESPVMREATEAGRGVGAARKLASGRLPLLSRLPSTLSLQASPKSLCCPTVLS